MENTRRLLFPQNPKFSNKISKKNVYFSTQTMPQNVTVQLGGTAFLGCKVGADVEMVSNVNPIQLFRLVGGKKIYTIYYPLT
jgi:hypothetical protein